MTPRAWMLLLAAALTGVIVALSWPVGEIDPPIIVADRTLEDGDADLFVRVCDQLGRDRADVRIDLPYGRTMLQFATSTSRRPSLLRGTCERARVEIAEFLAILVALGKAQRVAQRRARWEKQSDGRIADEDLAAEVHELHGRKPEAAVVAEHPGWWKDLSAREKANIDVWSRVGQRVADRWQRLMTRGDAGG